MKKLLYYFLKIEKLLIYGLKLFRRIVRRFLNIFTHIPKIIEFASHDDELSSYPKLLRKSRRLIIFENIIWAIKHGEVNISYFKYLFDRKLEPIDQSEYMPYNLYHTLRKKYNRGERLYDGFLSYICLLRDKNIFYKFLNGLSIPTPQVVALYDDGKIQWIESGKVEGIESLYQYENVDFFCKGVTGEVGSNVFHIVYDNGTLLINGKQSSIYDMRNIVTSKSVFQKRIIQHNKMEKLHSSSVNTIRISTFNNRNNITVFNAILKLGAPGNVCDNWHFGGIVIGIDLDTGNLMPYGIQATNCANKLLKHPDSDVAFMGFTIPYFKEALLLAKKLHKELCGIYTIGWDIAITENGPVVIEGNDNWDFRMFQVYYGGCKKQLLNLFKE